MLRLLLFGLITSFACGQSNPPIFVDRSLQRVELVRDRDSGTVSVFASVVLMTNSTTGVDFGFRIKVFVDDDTNPPVGEDDVTGPLILSFAACAGAPISDCGSGTCPPNFNWGAYSVMGNCKPYSCYGTNGSEFSCACYYSGVRTRGANDVKLKPGQKVIVTIEPLQGADSDSVCMSVNNDRMEVYFGSRADASDINESTFRQPTPLGGQANTSGSSLTQAGLWQQGEGPYEFWGDNGTVITSTHTAPGMNDPVALLLGTPSTGWVKPAGCDVSVDLDLSMPVVSIYDGTGIFGGSQTCTALNCGSQTRTFSLPGGLSRYVAFVQGFAVTPTAACGIVLTGRNDVGVQRLSNLPSPQMPPFVQPQIAPQSASATTAYPFGRAYAIVPNIAQPSSAAGANDGDLISAVGVGFDATTPGATTATVNGVPVDIAYVRPYEILFRLNSGHENRIAGPLVINSTGGSYASSPDQMESWVFASPGSAMLQGEEGPASFPQTSGLFNPDGGLQGARGVIDAGTSAGDRWLLERLPQGQGVRALVVQVDPVTGQAITNCAPAASLPSPAPLCFAASTQAFSQLTPLGPGDGNPWLRHAHQPTAQGPVILLGSQDDGGPGTAAFAGFTANTGAATNAANDPFPTFTASASMTDFLVVSPGSSAPLASPFEYLLLVNF